MKNYVTIFLSVLFLSLSPQAFSIFSCKNLFSRKPGSLPFIIFLNQHKRDIKASEITNIKKFTKNWKHKNALKLVNYLEKRIGIKETVQLFVKSPKDLENIDYGNFIKKIAVYESYVGVKEVTDQLGKSLAAFDRKPAKVLNKTLKFAKKYMGLPSLIRIIIVKGFRIFNKFENNQLKEIVEILHNYLWYETILHLMENRFQYLILVELDQLKITLNKLKHGWHIRDTREGFRLMLDRFDFLIRSKSRNSELVRKIAKIHMPNNDLSLLLLGYKLDQSNNNTKKRALGKMALGIKPLDQANELNNARWLGKKKVL